MSADLEEMLGNCVSLYLVPGNPGTTLNRVIQMTLDPEQYAADLVPLALANPIYGQYALKLDFLQGRIKEWASEMPADQVNQRLLLERSFTLLGKRATRNLLASIRMLRIADTLPRKKNERFSVRPQEQLRHALAAEEFCESRNYAGAELAFLGGLQYDLLLTCFNREKAPREVLSVFPQIFTDAMKTAHFAYELGARMGSFPNSEWAFPAALSLGLGKALMYAVYPKEKGPASYSAFLSELEKKTVLRGEWQKAHEADRFELRPVELASLAASFFEMLGGVELAIRYSQEPYYLKKIAPKQYALSVLLGIAETLALGRQVPSARQEAFRALKPKPNAIAEAQKAVAGRKGR